MHSYKEENQRLKVRVQELENSKGGSLSSSDALTDDLRREITLLKSRIEGLEKELMNQEVELKAAKISLKDKNNDPMIKNLSALFQQFSIHLSDIQSVQKEMDKIFQLHKTTWDLQNLQTKLNLIESHQSIVSEEIYNSLHSNMDIKIEKDSNNNDSTISTKASKPNKLIDIPTSTAAVSTTKEKKNVKIADSKTNTVVSESNTLKRKRDSKSPSKSADSSAQPAESNKKQSNSSSQTIATILVSKTKTKSGLPLLLKK